MSKRIRKRPTNLLKVAISNQLLKISPNSNHFITHKRGKGMAEKIDQFLDLFGETDKTLKFIEFRTHLNHILSITNDTKLDYFRVILGSIGNEIQIKDKQLWNHLKEPLKSFCKNLLNDSNSSIESLGEKSATSATTGSASPSNVEKYNEIKEIIEYMLQNTTLQQKCYFIRYCLDKINKNMTASECLNLEDHIKRIIEEPKENNFRFDEKLD